MTSHLLWITPLVPFAVGLAMLLVRDRRLLTALDVAGSVVVLGLALGVARAVSAHGAVTALNGFLRADALSALVIGLTAFVALVSSIYAVGYFRHDLRDGRITEAQLRHYYVLMPLFVGTMLLTPLADNLGVMWVAIESSTLASVLLVTFYNQKTSFEAGWKYIIIGSVGISLALFGTVITYSSAVGVLGAHAGHGMSWSVLVQIADKFDPTAMRLAFVLVLLGYGTKAGLAPMHTWKPDAYGEAPGLVGALLAGAMTSCAFLALLRVFRVLSAAGEAAFAGHILVLLGLFSMALAAVFMVRQRDFKRMLAYSSVEHMGILSLGLGLGGAGAFGAMLHAVNHSLTKAALFLLAGNVLAKGSTGPVLPSTTLLG